MSSVIFLSGRNLTAMLSTGLLVCISIVASIVASMLICFIVTALETSTIIAGSLLFDLLLSIAIIFVGECFCALPITTRCCFI